MKSILNINPEKMAVMQIMQFPAWLCLSLFVFNKPYVGGSRPVF